MKKLLAVLMVFSLCAGLFCACAPQTDPTDTDTSVQATTDTGISSTSEADASTTDSAIATNTDHTTDSSSGTETDTPAVPTAFPFADTVYEFDWKSLGYTIPVKDSYEIFTSESYSDAAYDRTKESIIMYFRDKATFVSDLPDLDGTAKAPTNEPLAGKETISLSLPGVAEPFVFEYKQTSNLGWLDSPYKMIQRIGSVDYYHHPDLDFTMGVQRETGFLTWLFYPKAPYEWYNGATAITQAQAEAMALELLEHYYGKESLTMYSHVSTSLVSELWGKDNTYCVSYARMLGEYSTNEEIELYITKYGYFTGVSTFNLGLYTDLEETLTVDRVEKAKQDVLDAMPDDVMCYLWTIERDINGEYYLSFFCENREKGFEYDLTINIK